MAVDARSPEFINRVAVRVAGRLGMTFFLNHLRILRDQRELIDTLILLAMWHANYGRVSGLRVWDEAAHTAADVDVQPVSVNALAQSLKLPFETVRRRVSALKSAGLCEARKSGVVIPPAHLFTERFHWDAFAIWGQVRAQRHSVDLVRGYRHDGCGAPDHRLLARR